MNLSLNTIILYVKDIENLKNFYASILELEIVEEDSIWVLFKTDVGYIGLHKMGDTYLNKLSDTHKFNNNVKIVFEIEEDINSLRLTLLEKNVSMREIKTFENYDYWLCDGEDPEGNVFQLKQRKL